jgi:hypothetical protein
MPIESTPVGWEDLGLLRTGAVQNREDNLSRRSQAVHRAGYPLILRSSRFMSAAKWRPARDAHCTGGDVLIYDLQEHAW